MRNFLTVLNDEILVLALVSIVISPMIRNKFASWLNKASFIIRYLEIRVVVRNQNFKSQDRVNKHYSVVNDINRKFAKL